MGEMNVSMLQGTITDDTFGTCGFYQLDDSVTLCLSYVKLVTNIPIIKKGDTIVMHDVHRLRFGKHFIVLVCGRGNLVNRWFNSHVVVFLSRHQLISFSVMYIGSSLHEENQGLFPKNSREDKSFLQSLVLDKNYTIGLVFSLYQLCRTVCKNLSGILPPESVTRYSNYSSLVKVMKCARVIILQIACQEIC